VVYIKKGHYLETIAGLKAARVRAAMIRFVQKGNLFVVTLIAMYSETDSVKFKDASFVVTLVATYQKPTVQNPQNLKIRVYNVRKLHFHANLCEIFAKDQKQHYCVDLVLGLVVLQKTVLNH